MSALLLSLALAAAPLPQEPAAQDVPAVQKLRILAPDEIKIAADYYQASPDPGTPVLVLFHQARSSRGEYRAIAPRLRELGFNCLAVDLRSGRGSGGVKNLTARHAQISGKGTSNLDALVDMVTALEYAREHYAPDGSGAGSGAKLVAWGSSYSASLVLHVAATRPDLVDGVLSFSPGEYFKSLGKGETWIRETAAAVKCPAFVTGALSEEKQWRPIFEALASEKKVGFVPESKGQHGSSALHAGMSGSAKYWQAVEAFLNESFPRPKSGD